MSDYTPDRGTVRYRYVDGDYSGGNRDPHAEFDRFVDRVREEGAKWQRDQLRTDEAVERVLVVQHPTIDCLRDDHPDVVEKAKGYVRELITALLGEES